MGNQVTRGYKCGQDLWILQVIHCFKVMKDNDTAQIKNHPSKI
jgi:hypothetical protein